MKSLRQIVELKKIDIIPDPELQSGVVSNYTKPKSEAERNFVGKHVDVIQQKLHPAFKNEAEQDAVFKGGSINKDHSKQASYKDGMDAEVYESAIAFVKDNLTEENLEQFENMLEENPEAAIGFAIDISDELEEIVMEGIEDRQAEANDRVEKHLAKCKSDKHRKAFSKEYDHHNDMFSHHYENDTGQEHHAVDDLHSLADKIKAHNGGNNIKEAVDKPGDADHVHSDDSHSTHEYPSHKPFGDPDDAHARFKIKAKNGKTSDHEIPLYQGGDRSKPTGQAHIHSEISKAHPGISSKHSKAIHNACKDSQEQ